MHSGDHLGFVIEEKYMRLIQVRLLRHEIFNTTVFRVETREVDTGHFMTTGEIIFTWLGLHLKQQHLSKNRDDNSTPGSAAMSHDNRLGGKMQNPSLSQLDTQQERAELGAV